MTPPWKSVAICGPTASGKTKLSILLARALDGEIVNVDSVQVYRGLDIGSAKPSTSERECVPHHAFDIAESNDPLNVARFRDAALGAVADISKRGKLPILVGGSGMYFTALLHGLAPVPSSPEDVRRDVAKLSVAEMYEQLRQIDSVTAERLNPNDRQRISRALEVYRVSGRKPSEIVAEHQFSSADVVSLVLVLCRPRDELYQRINQRSADMVAGGLLEETRNLVTRYGRVPPLTTLGYKQALDVLDGKLSRETLVEEIALHTRRFAKRQMTYWRNEPAKRGWVVKPAADEAASLITGFSGFSVRARETIRPFRAYELAPEELQQRIAARLQEPLTTTEVWFARIAEVSQSGAE